MLVSSDPVTATNAANRDYAQPVYAALDGSFTEAASGFVGAASDGLVQLDATHALTPTYPDAEGGNVEQTAQVVLDERRQDGAHARVRRDAGRGGRRGGGLARRRLRQVAAPSYKQGLEALRQVAEQAADEKLTGLKQQAGEELADEYYLSANVLKASEDKTFPGAIVASLASPWGQAISAGDPANTYFGSYREVFARDLYEAWTGLLADGDLATARDATLFLFERQQLPDGSMPRNSLVNGKTAPDSFGTQLDEVAYPILMAQQLGLTDASLYADHVKPAANFLIAHGPAFGSERWEEQSGFSPSTIAAEIAGLVAAADLARVNGDAASAALWLGVADDWQRSIKGWTVTTNGPLAAHPYFIRLSKTGDPNAAITYNVGNGGPTLDQRAVIDAGFLELVRLGELPATDPDVAPVAAGRRRDDQVDDGERARLAPLQRRRLRRPRRATGGRGRRAARAPATSGPCCRPSAPSRRSSPATPTGAASLLAGHGRVRLRRRADSRAGLGRCPISPPRRSAPTRRSPRSASPTAALPARRRR